jgi:transcriptional regulator with XRE-family HTH domain
VENLCDILTVVFGAENQLYQTVFHYDQHINTFLNCPSIDGRGGRRKMTFTSNDSRTLSHQTSSPVNGSSASDRKYHRIAEVRREQGVSLRSMARQMKLDMPTIRREENGSSDLRVSDLIRWQRVLDVPLADLLVDPGTSLSRPVMERARMVRLMKTAAALQEQAKTPGIQRLTTMLVQQLKEIMPELEHISAWHSVGQRRSLDEYGRIVERRMRDDFFISRYED